MMDPETNIHPALLESESKYNPEELNIQIKQELIEFDEIKIKTEVIENIKIENESDKEDLPDFVKQEDYQDCIKKEPKVKKVKSKKWKRKYNCDMCKKEVLGLDRLKKHRATHANVKLHLCKLCNRSFELEKSLKKHISKHRSHKCNICLKAFTHHHNLKKHLERHIKEENKSEKKISSKKKKYNCTVCQKVLTGITSIQRHMLIHTGEKNYTCIPCNRSFALKSSLKKHERTHRDKQYQCEYCNKVLTSQKFLNNHLRLHLEEKKYTCTVCNCNFGIESSLRRHEVKHRADFRKHICSVCNRVFNSSDTLNVHFQLHSITKSSEVEEENTQTIKTEYEDNNINENID